MSALRFERSATDGAARRGRITLPRGTIETPAFMPVVLSAPDVTGPRSGGAEPALVVEFSGGARVLVGAHAPAALVSATLKALR